MRSLEAIGLLAVAFGWGWAAWKYFESDYNRTREIGGPEWAKMERLTVWCVIGTSTVGTLLTAIILIWLDG